MASCKFCGEPIVWATADEAVPIPGVEQRRPSPSGWVPCFGCECGALHDHRSVCTGIPMSVEAADNARRYAWARCYEAEREVDRLRGELNAHGGEAFWCVECDDRVAVVDGLCDPCLKRHYHKELA